MLHWRLGQGFILYIYLNILMAVQTKRVVPVLSLSTDHHIREHLLKNAKLPSSSYAIAPDPIKDWDIIMQGEWCTEKWNQKYLVRTWEQDMLTWREQQFWILVVTRDIPVEVETCELWVLWNLNFYPCFSGCLLNNKRGYYLKNYQRCPAQFITINLLVYQTWSVNPFDCVTQGVVRY